jgi:hypothetical protein
MMESASQIAVLSLGSSTFFSGTSTTTGSSQFQRVSF